jgi:hypothetical protein
MEHEEKGLRVAAADLHRIHGDLVVAREHVMDLGRGCSRPGTPDHHKQSVVQQRLCDVDHRSARDDQRLKLRPPPWGTQGATPAEREVVVATGGGAVRGGHS